MSQQSAELLRLLEHLKASRGFDFTGYKLSSVMRRVAKRMAEVGVSTHEEYMDHLEVHPDEFQPLFNTLLINVTSFFRDEAAWEYLAAEVVPRILDEKPSHLPIRVWSAGCASGEEAYTIAVLLAEALGEEPFRERVKIYATDADEEALAFARQGSYDERQVAGLPPELLARYFERVNGRFHFRVELRRSLIFGRHDLVQDAAISRLDLLVCRNTLMYLNLETQAKVLARFHFALNPNGYLFLGKAETLLAHGNSFRPVDLKRRVFQRAASSSMRDRLLAILPVAGHPDAASGARQAHLREAAFDSGPVAQVVVDRNGYLVLANERARQMWNLGTPDLGRLLQDLELSYRPVDLRSALDEAYRERRAVSLADAVWQSAAGSLHLEVQVVPLLDGAGRPLGASVSFVDQTQARQLRLELERANQELETAYEELQSTNEELETTNEELETTNEELETTNEELQSTNEELETTNEELQSANEELETMNEELQSTNEELRTMNEQLHERSSQVDELNRLLHSILAGLSDAVVVLNRAMEVEVWSPRAEDLWGLHADEVLGRPFLQLDIGIPVERLRQAIHDCLDRAGDGHPVALDGVNRRGKPIRCTVDLALLDGERRAKSVLLLMAETARAETPGRAGAEVSA